jgi:hypothetical protein
MTNDWWKHKHPSSRVPEETVYGGEAVVLMVTGEK